MNMRRSIPVLVFVYVVFSASLAVPVEMSAQQRNEVVRLESLLKSRQDRGNRDSIMVRLMLDLAQEYRKSTPERALSIAREAGEIARQVNDDPGLAMAYTSTGITHAQMGSWVRALNFFLKALQLKEQLGDQQGMAALLSNIGVLHGKLNDEERALRYHQRAVRFFQEAQDTRGLAYTYNNIGVIHMERGEYEHALRNFLSSLELKKNLRDVPGLASTYLNIGISYFLQGMFTRALENYQRSSELYTNLGDQHGRSEAWQRIGLLYFARKDYVKALDYGTRALSAAETLNARAVKRNALKVCSDACSALGRPTQALEYFRQFTDLKDSLFNEESSKLINEMTANYELVQRERSDRENELLKKEQRIREMELLSRAAQLKQQQQSIELLSKEQTIDRLKLTEQEAVLLAQRMEASRRDHEIALLQKDRALLAQQRELKESELEQHRWLRNSLIAGSVFLIIILLLVANRYRLKKKAAAQLQQKNEQLEAANEAIRKHEAMLEAQAKQIERTNEELKRQNEKLEKLNQEKNDLLGIVAHDLRNPIGGIRMFAESMVERDRDVEYLRGRARQISETADGMLVLLSNLLDINRLESGNMRLLIGPVPIRPVIDRVMSHFQKWAERKNIILRVEQHGELAPVQGDEAAVFQVVDNLVSNAIKYSPKGGEVLMLLEQHQDRIRIEVRDHGPGLSAEDQERLFQKFSRLSAQPTGGETSSGLGLSIVRKLVESMQGIVHCDSELGKGSRFIVELPAAKTS